MVERIVVDFAGDGSGDEVLAWGQRDVWASMTRYRHSMPIGGVKPLSAGTSVADIVDELRYLMGRFQVMRTRLRFDADGVPRQVVSDAGEITLEIVDTDTDTEPSEVAEAVCTRLRATPFDYSGEWPVRMTVVRHRGVLTHMVVIMCHLAMDGHSAAIMMRDVAMRRSEPVEAMQPLEQARWQSGPAGQRQNEAAMRHWETLLRGMPPPWPSRSVEPSTPRHWEGLFSSPAITLAMRAIAQRGVGDDASALLAVYAIAIARVACVNPVAIRPLANNRFRRGLAGVVSPISQTGLCLLDVAGVPFEEAVRRAARASMTAYKYAYYDTVAKDALVARIVAERGPEYFVDCFFNDRRVPVGAGPATDEAPTPQRIRDAVARSTFRWTDSKDTPSSRIFVQVDSAPDATLVNLFVDTRYVPKTHAEALTREMEAVAVEAALDPQAQTRVPVPQPVG